jgi:hypothetical protein
MFKRFARKNIILGRWKRVKPMSKVDFANTDHCGTCKYTPKNDFDNSMDISICALQSMHVHPIKLNTKHKDKE